MENYEGDDKVINIVEGYEVVGKSTYIKKLEGKSLANISREFGIDSLNSGQYGVGFKNSWIVGAVIASLGAKGLLKCKDQNINLDRGILSTIVYGKIQGDLFKARGYLNKYVNDLKNAGAFVTYLYHEDMEIAEKMFLSSRVARANKTGEDEYDKFRDFQDYWKSYEEMSIKFEEGIKFLESCGIFVTRVSTSTIFEEDLEV